MADANVARAARRVSRIHQSIGPRANQGRLWVSRLGSNLPVVSQSQGISRNMNATGRGKHGCSVSSRDCSAYIGTDSLRTTSVSGFYLRRKLRESGTAFKKVRRVIKVIHQEPKRHDQEHWLGISGEHLVDSTSVPIERMTE